MNIKILFNRTMHGIDGYLGMVRRYQSYRILGNTPAAYRRAQKDLGLTRETC